jgi:predicted glycosyl hydrolase (DUF1957 family)
MFVNSIAASLQSEPLAFLQLLPVDSIEAQQASTVSCTSVKFSQENSIQAGKWCPKLKLPKGYSSSEVQLNTINVASLHMQGLTFNLVDEYAISGVLPRSYFVIISQLTNNVHSFVFNISQETSDFFEELAGLRMVHLV